MAIQEFTPEEINTEEWRDVVGYDRTYQVSSLGRIKKIVKTRKNPRNYILTPTPTNGYLGVWLRDGKQKPIFRRVHIIVAAAFCVRKKGANQINHRDGVKTNNRQENLEYVTPRENVLHALTYGLAATGDRSGPRKHPERYRRGETAPGAKLTDADVAAIRNLLATGVKGAVIARQFHVSEMTISLIKHGRRRYALVV